MIVFMIASQRQIQLAQYKKQLKTKNTLFKMGTLSRCQQMLLLNLPLLQRLEWPHRIQISKIKTIGLQSRIFVVSNTATFSQYVMDMDSGVKRSPLI
jgi:hypothetical protein